MTVPKNQQKFRKASHCDALNLRKLNLWNFVVKGGTEQTSLKCDYDAKERFECTTVPLKYTTKKKFLP